MTEYTAEHPLRLIELFAGIGSQTQALTNIGVAHKVVAISEIDKYAIQSYEAMHGKANNLGDIRKIEELPDADLWTYSFPCFTGDALVLTDKGYTRIDEVKAEDFVLTHKNEWKKVTANYDQGEKEIVSVKGMAIDEIRCTANHRFYARSFEHRYDKSGTPKRWREFSAPKWTQVKDLKRNDYIGIAVNTKQVIPTWDGFSFCRGANVFHKNTLQKYMDNPRFWWIIGRYLGDGWSRKQGGIIICCGKDEKQELEDKLKGLLGYCTVEERSVCKFHIASKELGLFVEQFGKGASQKHLTNTILDLPIDLLRCFLDGYFSADGCFSEGVWKATSVSRELIYGIGQCIAKAYRRPYSIYKTIRPKEYVIEGRRVKQRDSYQITFRKEARKQDKAFYENGYIWFPFYKIEYCGKERVYDLSVEDDHSFTVNGLNVHGVIFDELHAQPNRALYDVMLHGSGDARKQPLFFLITTAGTDRNSICWEVHQKAKDILEGRKHDKSFYPVIYGAEDEDDWGDEKVWYKANPSLGITVDIDKLKTAYNSAKENSAEENLFRQLRLNQWVKQNVRWMPMDAWDKCDFAVDGEKLLGRECYGGLDLSSSTDITAFVLVFPPTADDDKYSILPFFWIPEDTIDLRVRRDHVPYDTWLGRRQIIATEGNVIHYGYIENFIEELGTKYHIKEIAFDRWGAVQMVQNLEGMGFTVVPFGQGFKDMSPPTKELMKLVLEQKIAHGGNIPLRWMMDNVYVRTDPAGNIKMDKEKSTERIDGAVATVMALDRAIRNEGSTDSVYNERGIIVI